MRVMKTMGRASRGRAWHNGVGRWCRPSGVACGSSRASLGFCTPPVGRCGCLYGRQVSPRKEGAGEVPSMPGNARRQPRPERSWRGGRQARRIRHERCQCGRHTHSGRGATPPSRPGVEAWALDGGGGAPPLGAASRPATAPPHRFAVWGRAPRPRPAGARGPSAQLPPTRAKGGGGGRGAAVCQGARSRLPSETPPAATGRAGLRHPLPLTGGRQRCVAGGGRLPVVRGGRRPPERAGRPPTAVPALVHGGIPALGSFQGRSPLGGHARPQASPSGDAGWTTAPT